MELLEGGDLFNHIVEKGKVEEEKGRLLFIQMLKALSYCHANSVVHRDLKLENFLINKDATTVKLTDFGFCNVMKSTDTLLDTYCGSPYYCAPEIFLAQKVLLCYHLFDIEKKKKKKIILSFPKSGKQ